MIPDFSVYTYTHMYPSTHPCNMYNQSNKWSSFILQIEHKVQNVNRVTLNLNPLQISWSQCLPTSTDFSSTHPIGKSHTGNNRNTIQAAFVTVPWFCAVCHFWIPFLFSVVLWTLHFSFFVVFREILIQCLINKIINKSLLNDLQLGSNIFAWDKLGIRKNSMMSGPAAPLVFSTCSPREWLLSLPGISPLNMCECKQAKLL